jgi:hypothetical protein
MIRFVKSSLIPAAAALLVTAGLLTPAQAAEVSFSCMKDSVLGKTQFTDQYKEYDVNIRNECPGSAYWSMCIERLDPWTHEVIEVHTPSGYVEQGRKSRVNLHMKKGSVTPRFRNRFQAFYVSFAYGIKAPERATCVAARCEAEKAPLRAELVKNEQAWAKAARELSARLAAECPATGWDDSGQKACEADFRAANAERVQTFETRDAELRAGLADINPLECTVHAGGLIAEN